MEAIARQLIEGNIGTLIVVVGNHKAVGMIGLITFLHPLSGETYATEMIWWVEPNYRKSGAGIRLLRAAERWAKDQGAVALQMIAPTPEVGQIYAATGFEQIETLYQKAL
jgi:GNAT superfamily N-acetyltransferase